MNISKNTKIIVLTARISIQSSELVRPLAILLQILLVNFVIKVTFRLTQPQARKTATEKIIGANHRESWQQKHQSKQEKTRRARLEKIVPRTKNGQKKAGGAHRQIKQHIT
ncbi:hypothetical protein [Shewanella indica]